MAVEKLSFRQLFQGLSTDAKPTKGTDSSLTIGDRFRELDTQDIYIFVDPDWVLEKPVRVNIFDSTGNINDSSHPIYIKESLSLVAAGKATSGNSSITITGAKLIMLDCTDCTAESTFAIDEAVSGATKPIYVAAEGIKPVKATGTTLYYSITGTLRYEVYG
jgi:hypothetical protein